MSKYAQKRILPVKIAPATKPNLTTETSNPRLSASPPQTPKKTLFLLLLWK